MNNNCEHEYEAGLVLAGQLNCKKCGLLKSTIDSTSKPNTNNQWVNQPIKQNYMKKVYNGKGELIDEVYEGQTYSFKTNDVSQRNYYIEQEILRLQELVSSKIN